MATLTKTRVRPGLLLLAASLAPALQAGQPLRFGWKDGLELRYRLRITGKTTKRKKNTCMMPKPNAPIDDSMLKSANCVE